MTDLAQAMEKALEKAQAENTELRARVVEMEMERDRSMYLRDLRDLGILIGVTRMSTAPRWTGPMLHALRRAAQSIAYPDGIKEEKDK
jgi:hypothetical protein